MSKPKPILTVTDSDVERVGALVESRSSDSFVIERQKWNIDGPSPEFTRENFWHDLIGCLLSSQQRSTKGSPVERFMELHPFPLRLEACSHNVKTHVASVLKKFGGIRMWPTIAGDAKINYQRLYGDGWASVETHFQRLATQRSRAPRIDDKTAEREAAHFAAKIFAGIGPKQSRNLWQSQGVTRYEIPLDSRVSKWINHNLSINVNISRLGDSAYYDRVLDYVQATCEGAGVLPCIFDAAAFDYEEKSVSAELTKGREPKGTTETGYLNANGQIVIRNTGLPGTDKFQRIYQLACSKCGHTYGANGSDCHLRLCPNCQGGAEGLPLRMGAHA